MSSATVEDGEQWVTDRASQAALANLASTTDQGQRIDANNTQTISSAEASPGSPWVGTASVTRDDGVVGVFLSALSTGAIGGTYTFQFGEDGISWPVTIGLHSSDFSTIRFRQLLNLGAYYRAQFEPDEPLGAELVFLKTQFAKQADPPFVVPAEHVFEEEEAAFGTIWSFPKAFDETTGLSFNVRPETHTLDYANSPTTPLVNGTPTTFTADDTTDELTIVGHGLSVGDAFVVSSDTTLPSPLATLDADGYEVAYWVASVTDADRFKVTTNPNTLTPIDITDTGTGVHTFHQRGQYVGTFADLSQIGHGVDFFFDLQRPVVLRTEWSEDGVTVGANLGQQYDLSTGGTWTLQLLTGTEVGDVYVAAQALTTNLARYRRIRIVNGPGGQIPGLFATTTFIGKGPYPGTFVSLDASLSTLSTALLTRAVQAGVKPDGTFSNAVLPGVLASDNSTISGSLPSGTLPTFDLVGPIVAANVIDTGWLDVSDYQYQSFHSVFDIAGVKAFLMNANDDQGNGSITSSFAFPTAISKGAGSAIESGAEFFDNYFRLVLINDSGSAATDWTFRSFASAAPSGPVILSLDQPIFDFFPAPIFQSIIKGKQPDGDYEAAYLSGSDPGNSSLTPLGPDAEFTGVAFDSTGYLGGMVLVESDTGSATNGVVVEFSETADFTLIHRSLESTYVETGTALVRFFPVMQGEYYRVRYINGPIPQSNVVIRTELLAAQAQQPMGSLDAALGLDTLATVSRSAVLARNDAGEISNVRQSDSGGLRQSIVDHEVETPIKAKTAAGVRGTVVGSGAAIRLAVPAITGVGTASIQNEGIGDVFLAFTPGEAVSVGSRRRVYPQLPVELDLTEGIEYWCVADPSGGASTSARLDPTVASGGTSPDNAKLSDDTRATLSSGQTLALSGFTAQNILAEVPSVTLGVEARIAAAAPTVETVAQAGQWDGTGGDVGSVSTTTAVTSNTEWKYTAHIARRKGSAAVNSVSGMGLTWTQITTPNTLDITDDSGDTRISVWEGTGTPTGDSVVQAIFSATATNTSIKVVAWSGVDLASPIADGETLGVAGSSTSYSDSITGGIAGGVAVTAVTSARRTHTPGSGFTELTKVNTGNGVNDSRLSVSYLGLTATGPRAYSGTFSSTANWVLAAYVLRPRAVENPVLTIRYEYNGTPGATTGALPITTGSDTEYFLDISSDRVWVPSDIALVEVFVDKGTSAANVEIDHGFIDEVETAVGASQFVTVTVVGDA